MRWCREGCRDLGSVVKEVNANEMVAAYQVWVLICVLVGIMKNEVDDFSMCVSEPQKSQKTTNFVIKGKSGDSGKRSAVTKQFELLQRQYDPFILAKRRRKRMMTAPGSATIANALTSSC
jgi:hypothetical protein